MKIRIRGNSVRYRLTKTEVETFCKTGHVMENTHFPNSTFMYALQAREATEKLRATFWGDTITLLFVIMPTMLGAVFMLVGYNASVSLDSDDDLFRMVAINFVS